MISKNPTSFLWQEMRVVILINVLMGMGENIVKCHTVGGATVASQMDASAHVIVHLCLL